MTQLDLLQLGFSRTDIDGEEHGYNNDWFYYSITEGGITFITDSNDNIVDGNWKVEILEADAEIQLSNRTELEVLLTLLRNNTKE